VQTYFAQNQYHVTSCESGTKALFMRDGVCTPFTNPSTNDITIEPLNSTDPSVGAILTYTNYLQIKSTQKLVMIQIFIDCTPVAKEVEIKLLADYQNPPGILLFRFHTSSIFACPNRDITLIKTTVPPLNAPSVLLVMTNTILALFSLSCLFVTFFLYALSCCTSSKEVHYQVEQGDFEPSTHWVSKSDIRYIDHWVAFLLNFFLPGVAQILLGQKRKGITYFVLAILYSSKAWLWNYLNLMFLPRIMLLLVLIDWFLFLNVWICSIVDGYYMTNRLKKGYSIMKGEHATNWTRSTIFIVLGEVNFVTPSDYRSDMAYNNVSLEEDRVDA
jgi:hypothetical protein